MADTSTLQPLRLFSHQTCYETELNSGASQADIGPLPSSNYTRSHSWLAIPLVATLLVTLWYTALDPFAATSSGLLASASVSALPASVAKRHSRPRDLAAVTNALSAGRALPTGHAFHGMPESDGQSLGRGALRSREVPLAIQTTELPATPPQPVSADANIFLQKGWNVLSPLPLAAAFVGWLCWNLLASRRKAADQGQQICAMMAISSPPGSPPSSPKAIWPGSTPENLAKQPETEGDRLLGRIRIDGQWYNAAGWAKAHPGGERWIRWFDGRDATAVFYALHSYGPNGSSLAAKRLARLPKCDPPTELNLPSNMEMAINGSFQDLRKELEAQGYFERSFLKEAWHLFSVVALYVVGTAIAFDYPVIATFVLGLGMQQAGWLAHDYIHGRGRWCDSMRWFGAVFNGHSDKWWTQKHSLHHSFTNEEELDHDIMMEPFLYVRHPTESGRQDSPLRRFQHIYGYPLLSIIYYLWRTLSLKTVIENKDYKEASLLAINYLWLFTCMPLSVAIGSIFFGGFLVGALVSATHQSEEVMFEGDQPDFVMGQFRSTRDAETVFGPFETYLWGGMDTQLEHHLFPTLPRYNYHAIRPILKKWAAAHGVDYRSSPSTTIIADNFNLLKRVADGK